MTQKLPDFVYESEKVKINYLNAILREAGVPANITNLVQFHWVVDNTVALRRNGRTTTPNDPSVSVSMTRKARLALGKIIHLEDIIYTKEKKKFTMPKREKTDSAQTFDSLIMECQDTLSIETEINKRYKRWVTGGLDRIPTKQVFSMVGYFMSWIILSSISAKILIYSLVIDKIIPGIPYLILSICLLTTSVFSVGKLYGLMKLEKVSTRIENIFFRARHKKPSESSKFEFLRDAYVGTIQNLNGRLETIKEKIADQIQAHTKDELQIKEYADIFENTEEPLQKIKEAIESLHISHKKVSEKQTEINEVLSEYIGENGYIAQKEKEIERIKVAQELSDRMKQNFKTTLEITKNVDILSDAIIPGIKQLMSFKIPELIDQVEFQCDKSKSFLQIST